MFSHKSVFIIVFGAGREKYVGYKFVFAPPSRALIPA